MLGWHAKYVMIPDVSSHPQQLPPTEFLVPPRGPPVGARCPSLGPKWSPGRWGGFKDRLGWHAKYVMIPYVFSHPQQLPPTRFPVPPRGLPVGARCPPLGPR